MPFLNRIREAYPGLKINKNVSLADYTTLKVGGKAEYFADPATEDEICFLLKTAGEMNVSVLVLGNGSNTLVQDGGFSGLVMHLGKNFSRMEVRPDGIFAQAGALLSLLSKTALDHSFTGLEFAQGIPGSVGGGVYMNAGAYDGELSRVIASVRVFDGEGIREIPSDQMEFGYRHSAAMEKGWLILGANFRLEKGEKTQIEEKMKDFSARRREKQPLEYPSAGSFFKRPAGYYAGALIEGSGLKGKQIGGAQVSEKHAGFLINRGGAKAQDFLRLMEFVQNTVEQNYGVRLETEVRIVGKPNP